MSLSEKIQKLLEQNPKMQYNAPSIDRAFYSGKDYKKDKKRIAKIRTTLHRLESNNKIKKPQRGFYQAKTIPRVLKKIEDSDITLHGIKLESHIVENNKKGVPPTPADYNNSSIGFFLQSNNFERVDGNKKYYCNKWWEQRKITFTIHFSGFLEIFIGASNNPLSFPEFSRCLDWLNGFLSPIMPFKHRNIRLRQVGLARDFESLQMEGVRSISVRKFHNAWARIYYKKEIKATRFEQHVNYSELSLAEAIESLKLLTFYPDNRGSGGSVDPESFGGMFS